MTTTLTADTTANENTTQDTDTDKKLSPKNKLSRGVDPNHKTTFVDFNLTAEENQIIHKAAKFRDVKVADLLRPFLESAVKEQWDSLVADADAYEPKATSTPNKKIEDMTPDEAEAYVNKAQKLAEAAQNRARQAAEAAKAMIAKHRAAAANGH